MISLHPFCSWIRYRRNAVTKHGIHSPFVYELTEKVFPSDKKDYSIFTAEKWRATCLNNENTINVTDFGTGKSGVRKISEIAARAAKSPREGQLLFRIAEYFSPKKILELGTSLGISTQYLHAACPHAELFTIEGCPETANIARQGFEKSGIHVNSRIGNFDSVLKNTLEEMKSVDLVYLDGNHRKEPTLSYFNQIRQYAHNDTVFIFDDIHWSADMDNAWETIREMKDLHVTIDLFHFGIAIMRHEQDKQHFIVKW